MDARYFSLLKAFVDEAKEGPRLFSFVEIKTKFTDKPDWVTKKFRLTLWCEHSRLPLPLIDGKDSQGKESKKGVIDIEINREWFKAAAPYLKSMTVVLGLVLPIAASGMKLGIEDSVYKAMEHELDLSKSVMESSLKGMEKMEDLALVKDRDTLTHGESIRAE